MRCRKSAYCLIPLMRELLTTGSNPCEYSTGIHHALTSFLLESRIDTQSVYRVLESSNQLVRDIHSRTGPTTIQVEREMTLKHTTGTLSEWGLLGCLVQHDDPIVSVDDCGSTKEGFRAVEPFQHRRIPSAQSRELKIRRITSTSSVGGHISSAPAKRY